MLEKETAEKIAVRAFTQQALANCPETTFTSLRTQGYFFDPVENGQCSFASLHW